MKTPRGSARRAGRWDVRSGDIVTVDFGIPVGGTPALMRPAVVVTADQVLVTYRTMVHVVPITSNVTRSWVTDVPIGSEASVDRSSVAQCHLCAVVDASQIIGTVGSVGPVVLAQIRSIIADLLDIP